MEILTKPKGWREILEGLQVGESVNVDYADANGVRKAICRMAGGSEFETTKVDVTIKKSGVETLRTCLEVTRIA